MCSSYKTPLHCLLKINKIKMGLCLSGEQGNSREKAPLPSNAKQGHQQKELADFSCSSLDWERCCLSIDLFTRFQALICGTNRKAKDAGGWT